MRNINSTVVALFILFSLVDHSIPAQAAPANCSPRNGWNEKVLKITVPKLSVPQGTPNNTVIFTKIYNWGGVFANCVTEFPIVYRRSNEYRRPLQTNIPGVSFRISDYPDGDKWPNAGAKTGKQDNWSFSNQGFKFELVKTGPVSGGTLVGGVYAGSNIRRTDRASSYWMSAITVVSNTISSAGCQVKSVSLVVPLGSISRNNFSGIGSTSERKAFTIPLDCDPNVLVRVKLDAKADASGSPGVIGLESVGSNTAKGVGIKISLSDKPVTFGTFISTGTALGGTYSIEMAASYYQTEDLVTAGIANGAASFTLTYN